MAEPASSPESADSPPTEEEMQNAPVGTPTKDFYEWAQKQPPFDPEPDAAPADSPPPEDAQPKSEPPPA